MVRFDEVEDRPMSEDFPPVPPDPPEGGWYDPPLAKVENIHEPPPGGTYPPFPEDPIDIRRFEFRVAKIKFAMEHPMDPKKYMLTYVDVGDDFPRPVVSELRRSYKKKHLEGRRVVALCNIEPIERMNIGNTAALMCAEMKDEKGFIRHELWNPPPKAKIGEGLLCEDHPLMAEYAWCPQRPFMLKHEHIYEKVLPDISVNSNREVVFKGSHRLYDEKTEGFVTTDSFVDCPIKYSFV